MNALNTTLMPIMTQWPLPYMCEVLKRRSRDVAFAILPLVEKNIPWSAIQQAWFQRLVYVPKSNRICEEHLTASNKFNEDSLQKIDDEKKDMRVHTSEFEDWLLGISDLPTATQYNFEEDGVEPEKYKMFFGIDKANFDDLVQ